MIIISSYFKDKTSRATCISLKWTTTKILWELYEQHNNHFLSLKFISMKRASIVTYFIFRILQGISSLTNTSRPPPDWFLSSLNGSEYPCNKNCPLGKDLSSFVSVIISEYYYVNYVIVSYYYVNITTNIMWEQFKFIPDGIYVNLSNNNIIDIF